VVVCLERGADLHMAQLMQLPLSVFCSSKIQIGFTFLVPAHLGSPGKRPLNGCVLLASEWWGVGVVICLERGADLHTVQLMPLPLIVSCFSKIQTGFTFLVPAHQGSPGKRAVKRVSYLTIRSTIFRANFTLQQAGQTGGVNYRT